MQPLEQLSEAATVELHRQIESLEPSAHLLNSVGFHWMAAVQLAHAIATGKADIAEIRSNGISLKNSVTIATAISDRHTRKREAAAAAAATAERARLQRAMVASHPDKGGNADDFISARAAYVGSAPLLAASMDGSSAVSAMHTLFQESERGAPLCITNLIGAGFSEGFAKELKIVVDKTLAVQRYVVSAPFGRLK